MTRFATTALMLMALSAEWVFATEGEPKVVGRWTVVEDIGRYNFTPMVAGATNVGSSLPLASSAGFRVAYLTNGSNGWGLSASADASRPGVEAIWMRGSDFTIGLAAMGTALTSKGDQQSVCNSRQSGDREKVGYSLCNSTLTKEIKDLGVLLTPLHVLTGKIGAYRADVDALAVALAQVDVEGVWASIDGSAKAEKRQAEALLAQQQVDLAHWRMALRVGDETLCGPVVEARREMVSIAVRGKGIAWQRREQVQPVGSGNDRFMVVSYCNSL